MHKGWVRFNNYITKREWYQDKHTYIVYSHIMLSANENETFVNDCQIFKGELLTTPEKLAKGVHLLPTQVKASISSLIKTNDIKIRVVSGKLLITINDFECGE